MKQKININMMDKYRNINIDTENCYNRNVEIFQKMNNNY